jgi:hypothetical protein
MPNLSEAFHPSADAIDPVLIPRRTLSTGARMPAIGLGRRSRPFDFAFGRLRFRTFEPSNPLAVCKTPVVNLLGCDRCSKGCQLWRHLR